MLKVLVTLVACMIAYATVAFAEAKTDQFSIALFYADNPPVDELKAFDIAVVDPDSGLTPQKYGKGHGKLFAYVSVGEVLPSRGYARDVPQQCYIGENRAWQSKVVDVSSKAWRDYFLDKVIEPLWQAGYRGFFLDTLDSYQLGAKKEAWSDMEKGLAEIIRAMRRRHPEAQLILNRGFEIFDQVKDITYAVAAESLYQHFQPATGNYVEVSQKDREWLLAKLTTIKHAGIPVIAIDYVQPGRRQLARQTAEKIRQHGFIPWVTDKDLGGLGVGAIEVMPRTVLGLYDGAEAEDASESMLNRYMAMPLNYLGYKLVLHDMRKPLPNGIFEGRYAGILIWAFSDRSGQQQGLKEWVLGHIRAGVPTLFLGRFGVQPDPAFLKQLGIKPIVVRSIKAPLRVAKMDPIMGFEQKPLPRINEFVPMGLMSGRVLLKIADAVGMESDAAAITDWGGYVMDPFAISAIKEDLATWVVDPYRLLKEALRLPDMPVPDTTTENGTRLMLSHVDGDGFESQAEWSGGRISATEMREKILMKYRVPVAVSIITGVTAPNGLYPRRSAEFEREARAIFSLPWIEAASHSFSHPFYWNRLNEGSKEYGYNLNIPGYRYSLNEEVAGSIKYINGLLPPGKKTKLFLWTGDCAPGGDAIKAAYDAGVGNMNSGDTLITETNRSITRVAPLGIYKEGQYQVFAPNQNENVYTNNWTGPFYGYQRVIETFRMTDRPRRLKPVNIYYHFYSASKEASLNALRKVYSWAQAQRLFSIYASEYFYKVLDFNRTVVARDGDAWVVRNSGNLRQMRIPQSLGYPEIRNESGVAGYNDHGDERYIHLKPGGASRIRLTRQTPERPYLVSAGAYLESFNYKAGKLGVVVQGYTPFQLKIGHAKGCRVIRGAKKVTAQQNQLVIELPEGKHELAIACP